MKSFRHQIYDLNLSPQQFADLAFGNAYIGINDAGSLFLDYRYWNPEFETQPSHVMYGGDPYVFENDIHEFIFERHDDLVEIDQLEANDQAKLIDWLHGEVLVDVDYLDFTITRAMHQHIRKTELTLEEVHEDQDLILQRGVWLVRGDEATEMQKEWDDQDPSKSIGFGGENDYWLFDDASNPPIQMHDIEDIEEFIDIDAEDAA